MDDNTWVAQSIRHGKRVFFMSSCFCMSLFMEVNFLVCGSHSTKEGSLLRETSFDYCHLSLSLSLWVETKAREKSNKSWEERKSWGTLLWIEQHDLRPNLTKVERSSCSADSTGDLLFSLLYQLSSQCLCAVKLLRDEMYFSVVVIVSLPALFVLCSWIWVIQISLFSFVKKRWDSTQHSRRKLRFQNPRLYWTVRKSSEKTLIRQSKQNDLQMLLSMQTHQKGLLKSWTHLIVWVFDSWWRFGWTWLLAVA